MQRLTEEASPVATVGATLSGAGGTGCKGGTLNCWCVPGGGRKWGLCWVPCQLLNPLAQSLATWEENVYFPPFSASLFWVLFFFYSFFFKATIFIPHVQQVTVLQAALALLGWRGAH